MPTALTDLRIKTDPPRKRWTRAEYERLSAVLVDWKRVELVTGELLSKMGRRRRDVNAETMVRLSLENIFGTRLC